MGKVISKEKKMAQLPLSSEQILSDFRIAVRSRHTSLLGRKEVLTGKAKFGIFGDGKEVAQVAMAHAWQLGDFRSGYYRDQTIMMALDLLSVREFFASVYAHTSLEAEPSSAGRQMNGHYATRNLNSDGSWKDLTQQYNISADISPTGSQMPRMAGLAYASRLYRELPELKSVAGFSNNGNEIVFGTIGNASCAEGMFWETINAVGVLQSPLLMSIWDDGYGISVPNHYQVTKNNVGELLTGFQRTADSTNGYEIFTVRGWDYPALVQAYQKAAHLVRTEHVPAIIHVTEVTQPQGHSTSGSHERYKTKERLAWEAEFDPIKKMREWMIESGIASAEMLDAIDAEEKKFVNDEKKAAWDAFTADIKKEMNVFFGLLDAAAAQSSAGEALAEIQNALKTAIDPTFKDIRVSWRKAIMALRNEPKHIRQPLIDWDIELQARKYDEYSSYLQSESRWSAAKVPVVAPAFSEDSPIVNGFEVMNKFFDLVLSRDPRVIAFGEDVGDIGDVNQGLAGMQKKHGLLRVTDTGIRECTILGQAIGMSMRGLRPIAEIQYLDYLLYALQLMSDDLATVQWRTKGGQKAPAIIRTRGHRLEGIWHSGSPMAGIIHLVRGVHVCVPRNFVQAAGMYNTLLQSDEPGLVVEVLNGYRQKEKLPDNLGEYTVALGQPEVLRSGSDVTVVTYGPLCRIAMEACDLLAAEGIEVELIDVQTLLPFDVNHMIVESLKKTNRILFLDEDVPGGVSAYMMQEVLEKQGGYYWLDSEPRTLAAKPHRPAYGTDGDYWSKPNVEDIFMSVYELMSESDPGRWPVFYR